VQTYGEQVSIVEVDAPNEPELALRYRVLTVPTTVLLDAAGRARAVNYGFANSHKLLEQVDTVLG
jgi:thioredoxin-like negative regulator of GroEL